MRRSHLRKYAGFKNHNKITQGLCRSCGVCLLAVATTTMTVITFLLRLSHGDYRGFCTFMHFSSIRQLPLTLSILGCTYNYYLLDASEKRLSMYALKMNPLGCRSEVNQCILHPPETKYDG